MTDQMTEKIAADPDSQGVGIGRSPANMPYTEWYVADFMEPVYYFCLRKTGAPHAAEDLASEITLEVLTALHRGTLPVSFPAWVWQIARNRYARWADRRRREEAHTAAIDPHDPAAEALLSDAEGFASPGVDSEYAHSEEMATLRRELAFLERDRREVVVAYYIEDRSVADIARALGEPEGTVKSRLFRARKQLKEGMNMAREFGPKSYKPENIHFVASGSQASGRPWCGVRYALHRNILLEAAGNPTTMEELSVALGVAMPYMEEAVAGLVEDELLLPVGNRYVTNFPIVSHDTQIAVFEHLKETVTDSAAALSRLMRDLLPLYRTHHTLPDGMTDAELLWLTVFETTDTLAQGCDGYTMDAHIEHKHPYDDWGFVGLEGNGIPDLWMIGHNGAGDGHCDIWMYDPFHRGMEARDINRLEWSDPAFLCDCLERGCTLADLSELERQNDWARIDGFIAHADERGRILCDIPRRGPGFKAVLRTAIEAHPDGRRLMDIMQTTFDRLVALLQKENHKVIDLRLPYCASMLLCNLRCCMVDALLADGTLSLPADPTSSRIAMYLYNA